MLGMKHLTEKEIREIYPIQLVELKCRRCGAEEVHDYILDDPEDSPWPEEDCCNMCIGK